MPRWAAPNATKVATSKERTRMMSRSAWLVAKRSRRESGSEKAGSGSMPARANRGAASLRMRPLGRARISFSFNSLTAGSSNAKARVPGQLGRMGGLPRGGPRLTHIPQMTCKTVVFQADRQQIQHPVRGVERDLVVVDGRHLVENKGGMGAPVARLNARIGLPAEAVDQENKTLLASEVGAVTHRDQRILDGGRDDAEIVGVERAELELLHYRRAPVEMTGEAIATL